MISIEEARIYRPSTRHRIPSGATIENGEENVLRAIENGERAIQSARVSFVKRQLERIADAVTQVAASVLVVRISQGRTD